MTNKQLINTTGAIACAVMASLIPFALVARSRATLKPMPPAHLFLDMAKQAKFKPQRENPMFADGRAMRAPLTGTLAKEDLDLHYENSTDVNGMRVVNNALYAPEITQQPDAITSEDMFNRVFLGQTKEPAGTGRVSPADEDPADIKMLRATKPVYVTEIPGVFHVTPDFLHRGQERFNIYCAPCHGQTGYGDGMVATRAKDYQDAGNADAAGAWVAPSNYHSADLLKPDRLPVGSIYNTITNGVRSMPRYDKQISVVDRWAITAYVKALQLKDSAKPEQLSDDARQQLNAIATPATTTAPADSMK